MCSLPPPAQCVLCTVLFGHQDEGPGRAAGGRRLPRRPERLVLGLLAAHELRLVAQLRFAGAALATCLRLAGATLATWLRLAGAALDAWLRLADAVLDTWLRFIDTAMVSPPALTRDKRYRNIFS